MNTILSEGDRCKDASVRVCEGMMPLKKTLKARDEGLVGNSSALNSMRTGQSEIKIKLNPLLEEDEISNDKLERRKDFRNKKKKNKKNVKYPKLHIKPHSSSIYEEFVSKLSGMNPDLATEALEAVFVAFLLRARKSKLERALIILAKLLKTHLGVSYGDIVKRVLLFKDMVFVKDILSWTLEDVEIYMKELLNNWKVAHKNEAFSSIIALMSTFLAIFYSADKKWSISIGSFSMFLFDAKNSCKGATSLMDAILKVSTYVISGLKQYVTTGSYAGFLYADDQLGELDTTVSKLQAQFKYVRPGNLGRFTGSSENQFDQELQSAISSGEKLILLYEGPTKKFVMDKVRMLRQLHCDFIQTRAAGGLRVAPFAYLLAGSTGLGKSSINEILMRFVLASNGFNHQDPYIVTLNSQDQYFSSYRSYVNGVIFDDFANVKHDFVELSPCDVLLKFVNNVPYYLNMAELEMKGSVVAEPKVVGVTTNVSDMDSSIYSNQPSSIMRRMKVHIYAKVRPEFRKEGTIEIDPSKVHACFGDNALAPDIWLFDVYVVKVEAIEHAVKTDAGMVCTHRDDRWKLQFVQWNGHDMKDANINELLLYIKEASALHYLEQNAFIERGKRYGGCIICETCTNFFEHCICPPVTLDEASATIEEIMQVHNPIGGVFDDASLSYSEETLDGGVLPHATGDVLYPALLDSRKKATEQNLKEMLFSWIIEGKYNAESICSDFISSCSKELQYLLITLRKLAEKWFQNNRRMLSEMFFPTELEGTRIGDYYSIVVRHKEVKYVTLLSYGFESCLRLGLFSSAYSMHRANSWYSPIKYLIPFAGQYVISRMNIPSAITQMYAEGRACFIASKKFFNGISSEALTCSSLAVLTLGCSFFGPRRLRGSGQILTCALMSFGPFMGSHKRISSYDAPRALSILYKKEKKDFLNDWAKLAPAALTMSTLYYSKDDIVDFYADACERWYMQPQSRLKPTPEEIIVRDKKHKFDGDWFKDSVEAFLDPLPTHTPRTPSEVRHAVEENVWMVENLGTSSKSNCFVICTGCVLIPYHYIPKISSTFKFTRHNRGNQGNKSFEVLIEPAQCVRVKNYDLAMLWLPQTRDVRNLIDFFPLEFKETNDDRVGRIATRSFAGDLEWSDVRELFFTRSATSGMGYSFPGAFYIWNGAKEGKCLSPVITDDKQACISSLHIGGSTQCRSDGGFISFGVTPTRQDLLDTKALLERFSTVLPMSASGDFPIQCMGIDTLQRTIKKKSCYLRMDEENSARFFGSSMNCNRTPKSMVRDTPIKASVKELFDIVEDWGSPKFRGSDGYSPHEPWETGMSKWIVNKPGLPFGLLNRAKTDYTNVLTRVLYGASEYWKSEIRVLTWDETVNGIPGKRFIDSINFKSSIGFPFKGSKKLFSENLGKVDGWQDKRVLSVEFIEEAEKIEDLYRLGQRYYPWFTSTLKDEPTLSTKDKVRVFQATSTPFQLVMRKYTLGICRFLQMNPLDSECAVGIDPCSSEWNEMYKHLNGVQTTMFNRWFAIDYKAYDTSIPSQMIVAIGRIFIDIAKAAGYAADDIIILNSIFTELAFSVVDFNGDVLMLDGANPSGNSLTVFINNLCNSLLMRIYFYHLYPKRSFSSYVRMMCYGDDLIAAVGALAGSFTMKGYAAYMEQFGFTVTPAQKEEKLKDFSKLNEIDFLKRKFVWSDDYGSMIAPLEEMSIYKRLCNYMKSETSVEVITGANIDGALDEWAFYGKAIYLERQAKLIKIVDKFALHRFVHRLHYTYEQRVAIWRQQNADPAVMGKGQSMDTDSSNCDSEELGFFGWGNIILKMGIGGPPRSHNSGSISSDDQMSINLRTTETQINLSNDITLNISSTVDAKKLLRAGELNIIDEIIPHSTFKTIREEIMTMTDGSSNQVVDISSGMDETRKVNDASDNSLGAFLSRPIKIASWDWTPGTVFDVALDPWNAFLGNKRVINRIATYKLLRAKLRVKFLINGNSFFYGRVMASYHPLIGYDTLVSSGVTALTLCQYSQMPRIFLDPTTSQGGEMCLPFFWHNDYMNILGTDFQNIGYLFLKQINGLKHTSGDVSVNTRSTITVYAWMEDVQLEAPTTANPSIIVPQSTGLSNTGDIPSYAYSSGAVRPSLNQDLSIRIPKGTTNSMLTNGVDSVDKLTLTKEQKVSLDPRILGLGPEDEMGIAFIASKESYLTSFNWTQLASREDLLFSIRVTPAHYLGINSGVPAKDRYQFTAACGAIIPFRYWHGTFKLRLQVVSSAFHKGRLAVVYDPERANVTGAREDNAAYTQIIDISTCRDVTFEVGPNQDRSMLSYARPASINTSANFSTSALSASPLGNGTISIYVINELALPNALSTVPNDIQINVFTSMSSDFKVFAPSGSISEYMIVPQSTPENSVILTSSEFVSIKTELVAVVIVPQSSGVDVTTTEVDGLEESEPYNTPIASLDQHTVVSNHLSDVYMGEEVKNFRQMLKRYYPWAVYRSEIASATFAPATTYIGHRIFPAYRGAVAGAKHATSTSVAYNYFGVTLLNFLAPAFSAWRGSIKYKMYPRCKGPSAGEGLTLVTELGYAEYFNTTTVHDLGSVSKTFATIFSTGSNVRAHGNVAVIQSVNPVVEYEVPWYEAMRFCPGKVQDWTSLVNPTNRNVPLNGAFLSIDHTNPLVGMYELHVATGDDFGFYFFTGWPLMYYSPTVPIPSAV